MLERSGLYRARPKCSTRPDAPAGRRLPRLSADCRTQLCAAQRMARPRPRRADHRRLGRGFLSVNASPIPNLVQALRDGRLTGAAPAFMVRYAVPAVGETAAELSSPLASGLGPQHAALSLNALAAELKPRADAAVHELATSGPDIAGTTRDTGVVLRELFAEAEHRVLVVGFAVQDGEIFAISRIGCVSGSISRCASASMSGPSPATRRGRTRCCARRGLRTWCGQALRTSRDVLVNTRKLARPRGVEPPTPRSVIWCSIQLSYGRVPRS